MFPWLSESVFCQFYFTTLFAPNRDVCYSALSYSDSMRDDNHCLHGSKYISSHTILLLLMLFVWSNSFRWSVAEYSVKMSAVSIAFIYSIQSNSTLFVINQVIALVTQMLTFWQNTALVNCIKGIVQ